MRVIEWQLRKLPSSIGLLKSLKTLDLENNLLEHLPHTLSFCKNLVELKLAGNNFKTLPAFIRDMENLQCITRQNNLYNERQYGREVNKLQLARCSFIEPTLEFKAVEDKKTKSPKDLYCLCAMEFYRLRRNGILSDFRRLELPQIIKNDLVNMLPDLKFCHNCKCGFIDEDCKFYFTFVMLQ